MEWILWVDNDTLFGMMDRIIPFMRYANKDLVVWANHPDEITKRFDANGTARVNHQRVPQSYTPGLNTGVLLIRNTEWSRQLLVQWAELGVGWPSEDATPGQRVNTTLQKVCGIYNSGQSIPPNDRIWRQRCSTTRHRCLTNQRWCTCSRSSRR